MRKSFSLLHCASFRRGALVRPSTRFQASAGTTHNSSGAKFSHQNIRSYSARNVFTGDAVCSDCCKDGRISSDRKPRKLP